MPVLLFTKQCSWSVNNYLCLQVCNRLYPITMKERWGGEVKKFQYGLWCFQGEKKKLKNLFHTQLTQDFGAHSLPAVLLGKNQLSCHTPVTLIRITVLFAILLQLNKTSTAPLQKIQLHQQIQVQNKLQDYLFQLHGGCWK